MLITGIGGQGVQLLAKTLALGAMHDGRGAMMTAEATDSMRGGHSAAAVVVGEAPLRALPVVDEASFALVLHPMGWPKVEPRLARGSVVVVNELFGAASAEASADLRFTRVAANEIASDVGSAMAAGFVLLGGFVAMTGLVSVAALVGAMTELLPPYRQQHIDTNARALRAGADALGAVSR